MTVTECHGLQPRLPHLLPQRDLHLPPSTCVHGLHLPVSPTDSWADRTSQGGAHQPPLARAPSLQPVPWAAGMMAPGRGKAPMPGHVHLASANAICAAGHGGQVRGWETMRRAWVEETRETGCSTWRSWVFVCGSNAQPLHAMFAQLCFCHTCVHSSSTNTLKVISMSFRSMRLMLQMASHTTPLAPSCH